MATFIAMKWVFLKMRIYSKLYLDISIIIWFLEIQWMIIIVIWKWWCTLYIANLIKCTLEKESVRVKELIIVRCLPIWKQTMNTVRLSAFLMTFLPLCRFNALSLRRPSNLIRPLCSLSRAFCLWREVIARSYSFRASKKTVSKVKRHF